MTESKNIQEYRKAYEKANNKPLAITFDAENELFFIEGLPYKLSKMSWMTDNLNNRIVRQAKIKKDEV